MARYHLPYLFLAFLLLGCDPASNPKNVEEETCGEVDYRNGVLFFPCARDNFANSLSRYREAHPDLDVVSIAGNSAGFYGTDKGYFVVVKKK